MVFKLTLEPIVECNWGVSLAHYLPPQVWDVLRREVYERAQYRCEICHEGDEELHCHEVWSYNDKLKTQTLVKLQCICCKCHHIKHWGGTVAQVHKGIYPSSYLTVLTRHFCHVNNCTPEEFLAYRTKIGAMHQARSRKKYKLKWGRYDPNKIVEIWSKKH